MPRAEQGVLFNEHAVEDAVIAINGRCQMRTREGHRVVLVAGLVVAQYAVGDRMAEAHARVSLVEQGWADQREVARGFRCSTRTVRRDQRRFEVGGLVALGRPRGYPTGRSRAGGGRARLVASLRGDGVATREIARRVGVSEKAIRKQLRSLGFRARDPEQIALPIDAPGADPKLSAPPPPTVGAPSPSADAADPKLSAPPLPSGATPVVSVAPPAPTASIIDDDSAPLLASMDRHAADRTLDRLLAFLGMLDDAEPLFRDGHQVPRAGVLLAVPALLDSGVLDVARATFGSLGPAFYGLRTTIVTLLLMALLRIKRPENLKELAPPDLGRILGLDRAPEVKTLRRKLSRLAATGRAVEFGRLLARRRVERYGNALGFLYVDGHVRVYHGERNIPKAHVARMRLARPATTDYWVNDRRGDPLFVVTAQANAGLVKMMPLLLEEVRALVGARRLTFVFDRGGYSPRLFQAILDAGFDFLTYRKGKTRRFARRRFKKHKATIDGKCVEYMLAERRVRLRGCRPLVRQVTRLTDTGHQTHILTSRHDLPLVEVAFRMFERWRQENFFKYLREEYALDALVDYAVEADDPDREVPNPKRAALDAELRAARQHLQALKSQIGADALRTVIAGERKPRTPALDPPLAEALTDAITRVIHLERRRATVPARIPVGEREQVPIIKLAAEKKHLTDVLKMVAYQAESELVRLVAPHYPRADDEGRTLLQAALASAADLHVEGDELRLTLAAQSSPHRTAAIAALCRDLDARAVNFPGSRLRLRFAVAEHPGAAKSGQV